MNRGEPELDDAPPQIDLAREAAFMLDHLRVVPSARTVEAGSWSQRLEPRVMQVLVMLAQASPMVVGRGDLNARVWGGRVVGDDAINRAVQALRRVAADAPAPVPFTIDTIPRVGYRLTFGETVGTAASEQQGAATRGDPDPFLASMPASSANPASSAGTVPLKHGRERRLFWPLATLATLGAIAVALLLFGWRANDAKLMPWTVTSSHTLDDLPPGASDVVLSPDGRQLAYRGRDSDGLERIFVRAVQNGGLGQPVSPRAIIARRPAWSPDGRALAFLRYQDGRPCQLFTVRIGEAATRVGDCETARDPRLAWGIDGRSLLFGDAPGENAVQRISTLRLADGTRGVLSSPPSDTLGDSLPISSDKNIIFRRMFRWGDEGWIARDTRTGDERVVWRRRGIAGSAAAILPNDALAVAWTQAGASGVDVIDSAGLITSQPASFGSVSAISAAGSRLLVEADHSESGLVRADDHGTAVVPLVTVRGRISGPAMMPDGRLRLPVSSAGIARIWERDAAGSLQPWGTFRAARIAGLAPRNDGRFMAALVTGNAGREIVIFDDTGKPVFRWNPHARSVNSAAWSGDGRFLITPVLDGSGWRLFAVDPFKGASARDLNLPGFAVVLSDGDALYAVRAGETTGIRELWRLDRHVRRLPIDLTLFDIVNWRPVGNAVWLPDRTNPAQPKLVLRNADSGSVMRSLAAPRLGGSGSGLAADARGPLYVISGRDDPEFSLLQLASASRPNSTTVIRHDVN